MRAFVEAGRGKSDAWVKRFWLIVPFDPKTIAPIFRRVASDSADGPNAIPEGFVERTFQVRLRVPSPVLTDWKAFLREQLANAFPEHRSESDENAIALVYQQEIARRKRIPTPRDIKNFVNSFVVLHRQWQHSIPFTTQAYYAVTASTDEELLPFVHDTSSESRVFDVTSDNEWRANCLAMHYGVPASKAMQVVLGPLIEQAFVRGDISEISTYQGMPGFLDVCDQVVSDNWELWASKSPQTLALAARCLSEIAPDGTHYIAHRIWRSFRRGVVRVDVWRTFNVNQATGVVVVLESFPAAERRAAIIAVAKALSHRESVPQEGREGEWVQAVAIVLKFAQDNEHGTAVHEVFRVPGTWPAYIRVVVAAKAIPELQRVRAFFLPGDVSADEITREIDRLARNGNFRSEHQAVLEQLVMSGVEVTSESLISALSQRLHANNTPAVEESGPIVGTLVALADANNQAAVSHVRNLVSQGHLFHQFHQIWASGDSAFKALCGAVFLKEGGGSAPAAHAGNSQAGFNTWQAFLRAPGKHPDVVQLLADRLASRRTVQALVGFAEANSQFQPLMAAIVTAIALRPDLPSHIPPALFVDHYPRIREGVSEETRLTLARVLEAQSSLGAFVAARPFSDSLLQLYIDILKTDGGGDSFLSFLSESLASVAKERWLAVLEAQGELVDLLLLATARVEVRLSTSFSEALVEHGERLLLGQSTDRLEQAGFGARLISAVRDESLERTLLRDIRDQVFRNADRHLVPILRYYGPALGRTWLWREDADRFVRSVLREAVQRSKLEEVRWLLETVVDIRSVLAQAQPESLQVLRHEIQRVLGEEGGVAGLRLLLSQLADLASDPRTGGA